MMLQQSLNSFYSDFICNRPATSLGWDAKQVAESKANSGVGNVLNLRYAH